MAKIDSTPNTITIPLTKGYSTVVDEVDADLVQFNWHCWTKDGAYYALRRSGTAEGRKNVRMHRVILERMLGRRLEADELVDHVDQNGLNNRRSNLRLATKQQNQWNQKLRADNTTGARGVYWVEDHHKWRAQMTVKSRYHFLGYFDTIEAAQQAYNEATLALRGEFVPPDLTVSDKSKP
jgi:hypothetical protein